MGAMRKRRTDLDRALHILSNKTTNKIPKIRSLKVSNKTTNKILSNKTTNFFLSNKTTNKFWLFISNKTSISPAPQRISDYILRRRYRIVTRKGAAIYEFHGKFEFESERVWFFDLLQKKTSSKYVEQRKYKDKSHHSYTMINS